MNVDKILKGKAFIKMTDAEKVQLLQTGIKFWRDYAWYCKEQCLAENKNPLSFHDFESTQIGRQNG